jgi:hypothetical protein
MVVSGYQAKRRKSSWLTHTKSGKPVMARAKSQSWGVTRVTTPRISKNVIGFAKRFNKGFEVESKEHPNMSKESIRQLVLDHLREKPDYYNKSNSKLKKLKDEKIMMIIV